MSRWIKEMRLPAAFLLVAIIGRLTEGTAFADPPGSTLVTVELRTSSRTIQGYLEYGWPDLKDSQGYLAGRHKPDSDTVREVLDHRGVARLMIDLKRVNSPREMYIFSQSELISASLVREVVLSTGPLDGYVGFAEPILEVEPSLAQFLDRPPGFLCNPPLSGHTRMVTWFSYNARVGESELVAECSSKVVPVGVARRGIAKAGRHPKLTNVFWISAPAD